MEKSRGKKRRQVQEIKSDSDDFQPSKKERRKSSNMIEGGVEDKSSNIMNGQEKKDPMKLIVEKAKSGRAECKKCGEKIAFQDIRIGIVTEGDWGLFTR